MLKRFIALALASTALALAALFYVRVAAVQTEGEVDGSSFTLSGRAATAAAQGELILSYMTSGDFDQVETFDDAFARYTVLVAEPVLSRSYVIDDVGVVTWYKMRVSETLSQKPLFQCSTCGPVSLPDPPADLLPLNADEILIYRGGGTVEVGTITVHYEVEQFPAFNVAQKYLFFLNYDSSKRVASTVIGPTGVFVVTSPDVLTSYLTDADDIVISNAVTDGMSARFGNSLTQLRNFFNPPPACDPDGSLEASCYAEGGSWNPTTCYCTPAYDPCMRKPWLCDSPTY
jgi:hypothetical protein